MEPPYTQTHMRLDIRGVLMNWSDTRMRGVFSDDGRELSPHEAKAMLLDKLANGHEYLPVGDCPDFDPKKGCPGHRVEDSKDQV